MKRVIYFFLLSTFIIGCYLPKGFIPTEPFTRNSPNAIMIGSISFIVEKKYNWGSYGLYYNLYDKTPPTILSMSLSSSGFDSFKVNRTINDTLISYYVLEHPPGNYEFDKVTYFVNLGFPSSRPKKIEIEGTKTLALNPGQIVYAGDLVINKKEGNLCFIQDRSERDFKKLKLMDNKVDWTLGIENPFK